VNALVDIAIVNHGQDAMVDNCLKSIFASEESNKLISSTTVRNSREPYAPPFDVRVIDGKNVGYGAACNECAKLGSAPYILFLNPDVMMRRDTLKKALEFIDSRPDAGLLGVCLTYEDGRVQASKMAFPTADDLSARAVSTKRGYANCVQSVSGEADWVLGAFLLARRAAFESVGGFDELFFLYYEEVDLAMRLRKASWRCLYCAEAQAVHLCGGAAGVSPFCAMHSARSRLLYAHRYFTIQEFHKIYNRTVFAEPFLRFARAVLDGGDPFSSFAAPLRGAKMAKEAIHTG
jgi:GT2 family glycosyltransferase